MKKIKLYERKMYVIGSIIIILIDISDNLLHMYQLSECLIKITICDNGDACICI